jgi:NMD protein affecting ribosome stability and mRNA decay
MVRTLAGKHPLYYEAVLQLRDLSEEVLAFAEKQIIKNRIPIAKKVKLKNGYDYFLADNQFTKALGKKLQQHFGGHQEVTASLHTKKDGKDLYRVTVLFRGIPFQKGDEVIFKGDPYIVKAMGKDLLLVGQKKIHVKWKDAGEIKLS